MKKFLSLILSVIMILSALPLVASADEVLTNVALNRPATGYYTYNDNYPANATDESEETRFMFSNGGWLCVDLEAEYTIDSVEMTIDSENRARFGYIDLYLSNEAPTEASLDIPEGAVKFASVGKAEADTLSFSVAGSDLADEQKAAKYRYVIADRNDDAIPEDCEYLDESGNLRFQMYDFKVFTADEIVEKEEKVLTDVALNRPGFSSHFYRENHSLKVTDGDLTTKYLFSTAAWYYVDLGDAYTIDTVKLLFGNDYEEGEVDKNYTVYLSNTRMTSDTLPSDVVTIGEIADTPKEVGKDGYTDFAVTSETKYRFVIIKHTKRIDIYDIKVMTPDTVAEDASWMVEVGAYKPIFATTAEGALLPYYANDRDSSTAYEAKDVIWTEGVTTDPGTEQSVILDLGEVLPLHAITYYPTNFNRGGGVFEHWRNQNVSIYVTNDPNTVTDAVVKNKNMGFLTNYLELPEAIKGNSYRYVVVKGGNVQKYQSDPAEYHRSLTMIELGVYSDSTAAQQIYSFNTDERAHLISYGMPAKANWDDLSGNANTVALSYPASVADGDLTTEWAVYGGNAKDVYIMLDLGTPQTIDYVTAMSGKKYNANNVNRAAEIFVSNTDEFSTDNAVIMHTEGVNGMQPQNTMRLYQASEAMDGNKYRYVGVRIPDRRADGGTWARTDLVMLDVYTKEANLDEVFTEVTFEQDAEVATKFSVKADKLLSVTGREYKFIAAAYDDNDKLLGVKMAAITPQKGVGAALDATIDFAEEEYADSVVYAKTMLWDMEGNLRPIVASAICPPVSLLSANKPSLEVKFGDNNGWKTKPEAKDQGTKLTDGDTTTGIGWGPATINGLVFVDLGSAKNFNKVTGYANYERGSSGREIYLSNINPNPTVEEAMALTGKTDATEALEAYYNLFVQNSENADIEYVGNLKTHTANGEFSFDVDGAGSYRYVVVKYEVSKASNYVYELRAIREN